MMNFDKFKKDMSLNNDEIFKVNGPYGELDLYNSMEIMCFIMGHFSFANEKLKGKSFSCYSYIWLLQFFKIDSGAGYDDDIIYSVLYHIPENCEKIKVMLLDSIQYFKNNGFEEVVDFLSHVNDYDRIDELSRFVNKIIFEK